MKTIYHPVTGHPFKMGRNRPAPGTARRMRFGTYLLAVPPLPKAPDIYDASVAGAPCLARIYRNDQLGDCTAAGAFHIGGTILANAGVSPCVFPDNDVVNFYSATSGYKVGDQSTDNGADEVTVLNWWRDKGLLPSAHRISGWLAVDATDPDECRLAAWLFENLYFGVELPDAWVSPMPATSGFTWDVAGPSNPDNGHCFISPAAYSETGPKIATWGMTGTITWAAVEKYAATPGQGELYCIISRESIAAATAKAPNGLDWDQLAADFAALGGIVT